MGQKDRRWLHAQCCGKGGKGAEAPPGAVNLLVPVDCVHCVCQGLRALSSAHRPCRLTSGAARPKGSEHLCVLGPEAQWGDELRGTRTGQQSQASHGAKVATRPVGHATLPSHRRMTVCTGVRFIGLKILEEESV